MVKRKKRPADPVENFNVDDYRDWFVVTNPKGVDIKKFKEPINYANAISEQLKFVTHVQNGYKFFGEWWYINGYHSLKVFDDSGNAIGFIYWSHGVEYYEKYVEITQFDVFNYIMGEVR